MKASLSHSRFYGLAVAVCAALSVTPTFAAGPYSYNINPSQSNLNLTASGSLLGGALTISEQFPSDLTKYDGSIEVQIGSPLSASPTIAFPGGSSAEGQNLQGSLFGFPFDRTVTPGIGGSGPGAPANYGLNFTAPLDIALPDIPGELTGGLPISLGTLGGVQLSLALRDVVWDVQTNTPGGLPINGSNQFDASGVQIGLIGGFADLAGSLVLSQDNVLVAVALETALNLLAGSLPDLGLTISRPNIFSSDVLIGIGTRVDLSGLAGNLLLPNGAVNPGLVTLDSISNPGFINSTLTLPIDISLGDFGLPTSIIDLDLGFNGQFVATATFEAVPEPTSGSLLAVAAIGFLGIRPRRRRSD